MEMNSQVCDSTSITKHGFPLVSPWARARLSFNLFLNFFQMKFASQHIRSTKNKTCGLSSPFFFFCALLHVSASMNNLYQSKTFSLFKSAIFFPFLYQFIRLLPLCQYVSDNKRTLIPNHNWVVLTVRIDSEKEQTCAFLAVRLH